MRLLALLLVPFTLFAPQRRIFAVAAEPHAVVVQTFKGQVSWYGDHEAGRKTACGQRFDPAAFTVAHPYLPCGTWVRVSNGSRSTFAKVTDRGPYAEGREMDVSPAVRDRIALHGVIQAKIEVVRFPDGTYPK